MFGGRKTQTQQTAATPSPGQPTPSQGARQPVGFETVLGANTTLKGDLTSKANVRIDGTFEGGLEIEAISWSARQRTSQRTFMPGMSPSLERCVAMSAARRSWSPAPGASGAISTPLL
jgi:hypothetical protein